MTLRENATETRKMIGYLAIEQEWPNAVSKNVVRRFCWRHSARPELTPDLIVLPSTASEANFNLSLPPGIGAVSSVTPLLLTDTNGHWIWPQPKVEKSTVNGQTVEVPMSNI
jgi:hypothetical protein